MNVRSASIGQVAELVVGDHLEGQFEGQNAARERLSELR